MGSISATRLEKRLATLAGFAATLPAQAVKALGYYLGADFVGLNLHKWLGAPVGGHGEELLNPLVIGYERDTLAVGAPFRAVGGAPPGRELGERCRWASSSGTAAGWLDTASRTRSASSRRAVLVCSAAFEMRSLSRSSMNSSVIRNGAS